MANPPTFPSDGRLTTLQNFTGSFTGGELFEVVSPGNASLGVNYNVTSSQLASGITNLSKTLDVFLIVGDSNAVGQGNSSQSPSVQSGTVLNYVGSSKTIVTTNDPVASALPAGLSASTGSAWPAFGGAYYKATGRKVGLVVTGVGGSTQSSAADFGVGNGNWDLTGANYPNAITAFNTATAAFAAAGYIVNFKGVIVNLGANDAEQIDNSVIVVGQYQTAFVNMLARFRATFSNPELPIYVVQTGTNLTASDSGYSQVRAAQITVINADLYTSLAFFNTFDFLARGLMNSGAHYTQAGYNEVGGVLASNIIIAQIEAAFQRNGYALYWSQGNVAVGYPVADALLTINPNTAATGVSTSAPTPPLPPAVANPPLHVIGNSGGPLQTYFDAYGGGAILNSRAIGGTLALPVAVPTNTAIFTVSANVYTGAAFPASVPGYFQFRTTELQSPTTLGNRAEIATTKTGTATRAAAMGWENDGGVTIPPSVTGGSMGAGTVNVRGGYFVNGAQLVQTLGQSHVPFVLVSSGSMGNNGALSGLTAVATAYPNAYVWMPAGAIASGSAAGWYYATFSTTQAATVFNNIYTSGTPAIPGSPTPFVTTGPGAYTQTTGSDIAAYTLVIPGNAIGVNGTVFMMALRTQNSSAGAKTFTGNYGSYAFGTVAQTTTLDTTQDGGFSNRGVTNVQVPLGNATLTYSGGSAVPPVFGAIDSTSSQNFVINLQLATATDTMTLENIVVQLIPGVP